MTVKSKGSLVVILLLAVVGILFTVNVYNGEMRERDLARSVADAREATAPVSYTQRSGDIDLLYKANVLPTKQPSFSSKTDVCYINHFDQGLIPASYYQSCYLRYVDGFETEKGIEEIRLLTKSAEQLAASDAHVGTSGASEYCGDMIVLKSETAVSYVDLTMSDKDSDCAVPDTVYGRDSIQGVSTIDKTKSAVYKDKIFAENSIKPNGKYIIVQQDVQYVDSVDVGCFGWPVCLSPIGKAVSGR